MTAQLSRDVASIAELPCVPAVYALYGGQGQGLYVAYVGMAGALKTRIVQHLMSRDASMANGTAAVGLNPDQVTEIRWWEHAQFAQRAALEAAELVAFDVLDPAPRSRGGIHGEADRLYGSDEFRTTMQALFVGEPTGRLVLPRLLDAFVQIAALTHRIDDLEARLAELLRAQHGVRSERT